MSLSDLATLVQAQTHLVIVLTDKRKLDPWQAAADMWWNYTTGITSATCYVGHYVALVS